jgi:hypothetical protein
MLLYKTCDCGKHPRSTAQSLSMRPQWSRQKSGMDRTTRWVACFEAASTGARCCCMIQQDRHPRSCWQCWSTVHPGIAWDQERGVEAPESQGWRGHVISEAQWSVRVRGRQQTTRSALLRGSVAGSRRVSGQQDVAWHTGHEKFPSNQHRACRSPSESRKLVPTAP